MQIVSAQVEEFVTGATATAVNLKTNRSYKSVLKKGSPHFARLSTGDYRVTVYKPRFKQSVRKFPLTCADDFWEMPMYPGSPKETQEVTYIVSYGLPSAGNVYVLKGGGDDQAKENSRPTSVIEDENISGKIENESVPEKIEEPPATPKTEVVPTVTEIKSVPKTVNFGVLNGKTIYFPKPEYPAAAKAAKVSGAVVIKVSIDEKGNVISASASSGHPLLRQAAEDAARLARFKETLVSGQPVKVNGILVYNFVP